MDGKSNREVSMTDSNGNIEVSKLTSRSTDLSETEVPSDSAGFAETEASSDLEAAAPRFGGIGGILSSSLRSVQSAVSLLQHPSIHSEEEADLTKPFTVSKEALSDLSNDRTRSALIKVIENGLGMEIPNGAKDVESPPLNDQIHHTIKNLISRIRTEDYGNDADMETAAEALSSYLLRSSTDKGIPISQVGVNFRREFFGSNAMADKKIQSFLYMCYEAVQDFVLIMLIILGVLSIVIETTIGKEKGESCDAKCYVEGVAILTSVCIVVGVTAGIDYAKQFAFIRLTHNLEATNTKSIIRGGQQMNVVDGEIVVGDILQVNSHNQASIPADCILLGPMAGTELRMDEASLTGESVLIRKMPGDVVLSGTTVKQGSGKMVVIAVGTSSVAGKIKARVYETDGADDDLEGDDESPLFKKLDLIAKQIGWLGTGAALVAFAAMCIIGLAIHKEKSKQVVEYFIVAVTVLAVAVPEGLPLAVTLSLAFSSNKMMAEQNLVKHLDACETMGCATTICTDKTGTLTANRMTARAIYLSEKNYVCNDPSQSLGDLLRHGPSIETIKTVANLISINSMNESTIDIANDGKTIAGTSGNPTECALIALVHELGHDYQKIRHSTRGRSDTGLVGSHFGEGKQFEFSSARKMMSWAIPITNEMDVITGYRLYVKGASEAILSRSSKIHVDGSHVDLSDDKLNRILETSESYSRMGMRCLALAYCDLPKNVDFDAKDDSILNLDGSAANQVETDLIFCALVGIEDPLRPEVPGAIQQCYEAGIDVRMVTGDSPNTAVSIAYQAGILRPFHFRHHGEAGTNEEMVAANLKENVLMEGKDFREQVYRVGNDGKKEFDQLSFDKIWPHLRVLARSSPDDKLTLAHGLNQSRLYSDESITSDLLRNHDITIFPDRQVVAMTGDGTNDAPALKRADIGFAMGISGTQIAKDAADIILLDDNFASIVTAAKWGRNVYASIQKFLQFQLTVNISAVVTALVGSFAYQKSPLAAIQLLWVNLLMDSLASLALASEPPVDELLRNPPVNRSKHMVTTHMAANMIGQASYQLVVIMTLLFEGPALLGIDAGNLVEKDNGLGEGIPKKNSIHYTLIFNAFVWMQLFNEINSRFLKGEFNVLKGILNNPLFCGILLTTSILQVIMVEFGSYAMHCAEGGLSIKLWILSIALGAGSLPIQQIINMWFSLGQKYKRMKESKRLARDANLSTRRTSSQF